MMVKRHVDGDATALGSKWSSVGSKNASPDRTGPFTVILKTYHQTSTSSSAIQGLWGLESCLAHFCAQTLRGVQKRLPVTWTANLITTHSFFFKFCDA
jgi:hypothetical protein